MENTTQPMKWYNYLAAYFAGFFITNFVPHFVNGISGNPFPSPFADPPGKGLSSPQLNVLWALFNLLVGYLLSRAGKINSKNKPALTIFFISVIIASMMLSNAFVDKVKI